MRANQLIKELGKFPPDAILCRQGKWCHAYEITTVELKPMPSDYIWASRENLKAKEAVVLGA